MTRALDGPESPRPLWHLGVALAGTAALCALLFALMRLASVSAPSSGPESLASTPPAPVNHEEPTADEEDPSFRAWLADTVDAGQFAVTRPLPSGPFKGQKRPPCKRPSEVELVGGCWAPHKLKAPCPEDLFEYQGECYIPAYSAKTAPPQSVEQ